LCKMTHSMQLTNLFFACRARFIQTDLWKMWHLASKSSRRVPL